MLDLTGKCCGGIEAIEFMESFADIMDEDVKTEEFCEEYEEALNRFRYEVKKNIGKKRKSLRQKIKAIMILSIAESVDLLQMKYGNIVQIEERDTFNKKGGLVKEYEQMRTMRKI